ncbi:hypothetical protein [Paraburkholderia adhaesiva]|uniref:hypothetical protein n=1 Tax=Paraburkholderia adhaesiva TaxID=2883244 RepID=UPI001F172BB8|nr:hypothetical protein [Paraburkholderia adhaesiva]
MRTSTKKQDAPQTLDILRIQRGELTVAILGRTPLIMNRLSEKAKQQLLFPPPRKTAADKAQTLKHDPLAEFRAAAHRIEDPKSPTLLAVPSTAVKGAMRNAALEIRGVSKAQIGRLCFIEAAMVPVAGIPQVLCSVTRMADVDRTPDVRTRCILREWAALVTVEFVEPQLKSIAVANLLAAAGVICGLGDWRCEKGSGSYGQFDIVDPDNREFLRIMKTGGRAAQQTALDNPEPYDAETAELLAWFDIELKRRGFTGEARPSPEMIHAAKTAKRATANHAVRKSNDKNRPALACPE